jgi:hypothetical protein
MKNLLGMRIQEGGCGREVIHPTFRHKVETPIHDDRRELVTWECKEDGVKS